MYIGMVFLHLLGVFGFLLAHGVSVAVAVQMRRESQPARVKALLDLSAASRRPMYGSVALLALGGALAATTGGYWVQGWVSASMVVFLGTTALVLALALPYFRRVRAAVDAATAGGATSDLVVLLRSSRPLVVAAIGVVEVVVLLWLMVFKPF